MHVCFLCFREKYAQYLSAQVLDSQGRTLREAKTSFYYHLTQLAWVPASKPMQDGRNTVEYLIPSRVYLFSDEVHSLLGSHACYVSRDPSEFSRAVGKQVYACPPTLSKKMDLIREYMRVFAGGLAFSIGNVLTVVCVQG